MAKKDGKILIPIDDEAAETKIYEKNIETKILTPAQDSTETKFFENSHSQQKDAESELPTISWGSIGDYRIIRKIGEGGMGIVYEAEQQHPQRLVALKIIRSGFHTDQYHIKLFEREIQALARLKHPGIADIYESGQSDDGQIFFAMELVRGTSLLDYVQNRRSTADDSGLDVKRRLELFYKICEVVSYAHQRGVIHRDLKPDNILVTDETEVLSGSDSVNNKVGVKILDFGLARIVDPDVVGTEQLSRAGQIKGTLQYMSPEQVRGKSDEIDVRSDVYSLGVMLYVMLTGQFPYDISQASIPEAVRIICEEATKLPDRTRSETSGENRKKKEKIDRDVETIVLKALQKEPLRRYQSAAAMADDIARYLTNQPILARPPSSYYQFRKLVARHKVAFASLAVIFTMLLSFGIVMAAQSTRIASERDRALKAEKLAQEQRDSAEQSRQAEEKQRFIAEENLNRAETEEKRARQQQELAEKERANAEKQTILAKQAQKAEAEQRLIAENNLKRAETEQQRAEQQKIIAVKQQTIAQEQRILAEEQRTAAEEQKTFVEQREVTNRRLLYTSQMNLAEQAWEQADIGRMQDLLENQIPQPGQEDLRGFEWYYLWRLSHRDLMTFRQSEIYSAAFSPDGRALVVSGSDTESAPKITLLDAATGQEIDKIDKRLFLAFSPDGKLLTATENKESTIELWDLKTDQITASKIKTSSYFPNIFPFFSPDGKLMARANPDLTVELLDVITGNKIFSVKADFIPILRALTFSNDSKVLALAGFNRIRFWDVTTGQELSALDMKGVSFAIAFSPDDKTLAGLVDGSVKLWDIAAKKELAVLKSQEENLKYGSQLSYIEFSPDGKNLAATNGRIVKLWDTAARQEVSIIKGHSDSVRFISFSPDSKKLITIGGDGTVKLWNIPITEDSTTFTEQVGAALSSDGKILATASADGKLRLWDFAANRELAALGEEQIKFGTIFFSPKFSPDGKILAAMRIGLSSLSAKLAFGISSYPVELWDVANKKKLAVLEKNILDFVFSPDGKKLVTVNKDQIVQFWDIATREVTSTIGKGRAAAFSPNGNILAIRLDNHVKLIDISTNQEFILDFKNSSMGSAMVFSPDNKILATVHHQNTVLLWDLASQKEIVTLKGHAERIISMVYSPEGKRLVTASQNGVKIWDIPAQRELISIKVKGVYSVIFSPDGKVLITSGGNGVQIWRGAAEEEVLERNKR